VFFSSSVYVPFHVVSSIFYVFFFSLCPAVYIKAKQKNKQKQTGNMKEKLWKSSHKQHSLDSTKQPA
jgi:hypothetical protein